MIKPSTSLILTGFVVGGGRLTQNTTPIFSQQMVVGGTILVFGIAAMNSISPNLAATFALLILVVAFLTYGPTLMTNLGFRLGNRGNQAS